MMTNKQTFLLLASFSVVLCLRGQQPTQPPAKQEPIKPQAQSSPTPTPPPSSQNSTANGAQPGKLQESDQDVVRITTNLVQVDVVVTRDNKQITDLKAEDFEIFEDGREQTITSFAYVSNAATNRSAAEDRAPKSLTAGVDKPAPEAPKVPDLRATGRTFALVVDDLGMSFESIDRLRKQLRKFIDESLLPDDLVAIIRTGGDMGSLQQFTTDHRVLQSAVDRLQWNPCSRMGYSVLPPERSLISVYSPERQLNGPLPPDRSPSSAAVAARATEGKEANPCSVGNSLEYSIKALRFVLRGMRELPGRKSMLLFSDNLPVERQELEPVDFGFKRPVRENANLIDVWTDSKSYGDGLQRLAELAIRASVVIYGIDTQAMQTLGARPADEVSLPPLRSVRTRPDQDAFLKLSRDRATDLRRGAEGSELIAKQTGGFVIRNANDLGLQRVLDDQSGYYLIGYRPASETFDRRFHQIKARVKGRNLTVRTRAGFYGVSEDTNASSNRSRIDRALTSPFGAHELTVNDATLFVDDPSRGGILRVTIVLDPRELSISEEADGVHKTSFDISAALIGDNGTLVARQDQNGTLRLRGKPYERSLREGMVYTFDLPVKHAGTFQFRVAVRDTTSSRIGAAGHFVEIPDLRTGQLALSGLLLQADNSQPIVTAANTHSEEVTDSEPLRRFRIGTSLVFGYVIYNARLDKRGQPSLTTETRVFRERQQIYSAGPMPVSAGGQPDLKRLSTGARLQLGTAMSPGEYVLQILVKDLIAKQEAAQWIQFQVVK